MTGKSIDPGGLRGGALALLGTLAALAITIAFEHWVVRAQIVLPALAITRELPFWMWAALFVPELVTCFVAGLRLRGWRSIVVFALASTTTRCAFGALFELLGEPDRADRVVSAFVIAPCTFIAYLLVYGLASHSAQELKEPLGI